MDPDVANILGKVVVLLLLVLVNAFFAMSEIAIISLNDNKVKVMAEEGHKGAKKVLKLTENPSNFLSTIQIGVTLAGFLTSASAASSFADPLANWIVNIFNLNPAALSVLKGVSMVLVTVIMSYFSLVLGELAPKRMAMQKAESISFKVVGILLFIKTAMSPFIKILSVSTNIVVRLFGFDPNASDQTVTEEEIRMMVDAGEEKGVIEENMSDMINNIFEFDDIVAADVMTHRTDITAVEISDKIDDVIDEAIKSGKSRIPVYEEELDNIKGILIVKDLLKYVGTDVPKSFRLSKVMREAVFIPESKNCSDLFNEMTEQHLQMVIVSDEFGGVAGLVTIEDLLESIVGNMQDEYDNEDEEVVEVNENLFDIDGVTDIEEVAEMLGVEFPEGEYETIGGFIMSNLGRIPEQGENAEVTFGGFTFRVTKMDERRIDTVLAERLPTDETKE